MTNYPPVGVIIEKRETDFIAGVSPISYEVVNPSGFWKKSLPSEECQKVTNGDSAACVTFSATNHLETTLDYFRDNYFIPSEYMSELSEYIDANGKWNFSDRFTAVMSGTTPKGNSQQRVWDSIRKDGLLPEKDLPNINLSLSQYYDTPIPQYLKDKAKRILNYLNFGYEWVSFNKLANVKDIEFHLKQCPLQIATPVCNWHNPIVTPCGLTVATHATEIYGVSDIINVFDSYPSYYKSLSLNYPIPFCLKGVVTVLDRKKPFFYFSDNLSYKDQGDDVLNLQMCLKYLGLFEGNPTGFYYNRTKEAVSRFQYEYRVAPSWVLYANGGKYCWSLTRSKLNEIFAGTKPTGLFIK